MMWGSLWDSVREAELDPREYVELAIKNLPTEKDETITASVLRPSKHSDDVLHRRYGRKRDGNGACQQPDLVEPQAPQPGQNRLR